MNGSEQSTLFRKKNIQNWFGNIKKWRMIHFPLKVIPVVNTNNGKDVWSNLNLFDFNILSLQVSHIEEGDFNILYFLPMKTDNCKSLKMVM